MRRNYWARRLLWACLMAAEANHQADHKARSQSGGGAASLRVRAKQNRPPGVHAAPNRPGDDPPPDQPGETMRLGLVARSEGDELRPNVAGYRGSFARVHRPRVDTLGIALASGSDGNGKQHYWGHCSEFAPGSGWLMGERNPPHNSNGVNHLTTPGNQWDRDRAQFPNFMDGVSAPIIEGGHLGKACQVWDYEKNGRRNVEGGSGAAKSTGPSASGSRGPGFSPPVSSQFTEANTSRKVVDSPAVRHYYGAPTRNPVPLIALEHNSILALLMTYVGSGVSDHSTAAVAGLMINRYARGVNVAPLLLSLTALSESGSPALGDEPLAADEVIRIGRCLLSNAVPVEESPILGGLKLSAASALPYLGFLSSVTIDSVSWTTVPILSELGRQVLAMKSRSFSNSFNRVDLSTKMPDAAAAAVGGMAATLEQSLMGSMKSSEGSLAMSLYDKKKTATQEAGQTRQAAVGTAMGQQA
eukprot:g3186.t1